MDELNSDRDQAESGVAAPEGTRRFAIYFKVNDHPSKKISDLILREYLKLKRDDTYTWKYCNILTDENEELHTLFRSLDDVDYLRVSTCADTTLNQNLCKLLPLNRLQQTKAIHKM